MGLEVDARLVVNRDVDLRKLPLTPLEFFIYSRVEALAGAEAPTVGDVVAASGQPGEAARAALQKLLDYGVLSSADAPAPVQTPDTEPSRSGGSLRARARTRRRDLLEAQMRMAQEAAERTEAGRDDSGATGDEPSLPTPHKASNAYRAADSGIHAMLQDVTPVGDADPRLQPDAKVDLDRQRRLLALRDRLRHIGHFELLGIEPVDDIKAIRRAYHVVSREFHPDSFYGQNLGGFRGVLDDLFRRARASYEILLDDEQRKPLVNAHLAQVHAQQARRDRVAAEAQAAADAAADRARVEAEARAAEAAKLEAAARKQRDQDRQARIRDRALSVRRKHAAKQAAQAHKEREVGRHGTAATLFRLAHDQDPTHGEYEQLWRDSLTIARQQRADASYEQGVAARRAGRPQEAAHHLARAAEVHPSLRNLASAASAVAEVNPARAREFAITALEIMQQARAHGEQLEDQARGEAHLACATAFLAAGQTATAKEQAEEAHKLAPSQQTRALLNSLKLT
ncbi:Tetratricopeptide repeat protein [Enhygromyxa salina]|uniref:Tetratricopeptide repeat protein n=1 Tax=Enhygromyxa salina TaxID=215803 RepID=A0A0C1Z4I5_9BACT|nr:J domain-containing protein [Enhygromyxa salina]KIG12584.1 Tetratricopeptide repeat protein [Enhygromyxa salina]